MKTKYTTIDFQIFYIIIRCIVEKGNVKTIKNVLTLVINLASGFVYLFVHPANEWSVVAEC